VACTPEAVRRRECKSLPPEPQGNVRWGDGSAALDAPSPSVHVFILFGLAGSADGWRGSIVTGSLGRRIRLVEVAFAAIASVTAGCLLPSTVRDGASQPGRLLAIEPIPAAGTSRQGKKVAVWVLVRAGLPGEDDIRSSAGDILAEFLIETGLRPLEVAGSTEGIGIEGEAAGPPQEPDPAAARRMGKALATDLVLTASIAELEEETLRPGNDVRVRVRATGELVDVKSGAVLGSGESSGAWVFPAAKRVIDVGSDGAHARRSGNTDAAPAGLALQRSLNRVVIDVVNQLNAED
jgi:hypothetical protein